MNKKELKKFARDVKAISPVIATLMLVLIAVASASAFYIWQSGWQNENQDNLDDVDVGEGSGTILVSGSTTVTPYMEVAAGLFMDEHPTWKVSVQGIGSSAGVKATLAGECDVGMASSYNSIDGKTQLVPILVGYDGVVVFVSDETMDALNHCNITADMFDLDATILQNLYSNNIETIGDLAEAISGVADDNNDTTELTTTDRAEGSGTEEGFCHSLMDLKSAGLNQMPGKVGSVDYVADQSCTGNEGVIEFVRATTGAIGFVSLGMVGSDPDFAVAKYDGVKAEKKTIIAEVEVKDSGYAGARPLYIFTLGEPTGMIAEFMEFVSNPGNMYICCDACGYFAAYEA